MVEDELLKWRLKCGSREALRRVYEKYLDYLLTLAMALLNDVNRAEDAVHDVFVSFAKSAQDFRVRGSLKSYLAACVLNRSRDLFRANQRRAPRINEPNPRQPISHIPEQSLICNEESQRLNQAISELPPEQRDVIILHIKGEMKFKEIAKLQGVSVNTIQGRYRYGLRKLRSILNSEVEE